MTIKVAIAGQPNCGKSTIFTMMSGVKQHVANYPGVTVEKKSTSLQYQSKQFELVDLPGTYSFSAYSKEEQATISFLLDDNPDIIINVIDASCLKRSLHLTYQLLEIGKPIIIVMNMMDVAKRRGLKIDIQKLSKVLNIPIVEAVGARGIGKKDILNAILTASKQRDIPPQALTYSLLEPAITKLESFISQEITSSISARWLAIKLLERHDIIEKKITETIPTITPLIEQIRKEELPDIEGKITSLLATARYEAANELYTDIVQEPVKRRASLTTLIDKIVLNRWLSFLILGLVIYGTYELSIVKGYEITNHTWPYFAKLKNFIVSLLPKPEFIEVPMITEFIVWLVNSALALLNYLPIFFILFIIIAILEDTGYMPRIAFVLDRLFHRYGLHGQSTLPLVLGGAFVGGCAVPGIMATKGIADDRARIATIMTVPYMNCLAKVPFYTLLLGAFFVNSMSLMMFFISTITFFIALSIARILTFSILKNRETTPFIMELPPYHLPTFKGVMLRALQRIWLYIHKVGTIVMAVAIVLFVLLQFPGISQKTQEKVNIKVEQLFQKYDTAIQKSPYFAKVSDRAVVMDLININQQYRSERMAAAQSSAKAKAVEEKFAEKYPTLFPFIKPDHKEAREINKQIRLLTQKGQLLQNEIKNERIENSFLGMFGRALEPVTQWAGFDWRINVAFLSSFAARESAVATIGSIYENGKAERPEEAFGSREAGYNALHAVAMLIFMIFTPPCIASMVVLKLNVQSYKLMVTAIFMPFILGLLFASIFFTLGSHFHWSGLQAMGYFYTTIVSITIILGFMTPSLLAKIRNLIARRSILQPPSP